MKNKISKKIICMLLSALMIASVPLSVAAVELNSVPVIYVGETADNALYSDPNKNGSTVVFDVNSSEFLGHLTNIVAGVALSNSEFGGVETGITPVITGIKGILEPILCSPNGESASSNVGAWTYSEPISQYKEDSIYTENIKTFAAAAAGYVSEDEIFFFSYDWRLDPLASADALKEFIDHVEAVTGENKVSILAVGNGGVVVNSYLYLYEEHAAVNVASAVFYNCSLLGNSLMGDFMTGSIVRTNDYHDSFFDDIKEITGEYRGNAFFTYIEDDVLGIIDGIFANLLGSGSVQTLFGKLFTLLVTTIVEGQDGHKTLGKLYNNFASNADDVIYDDFLREYLRNMPGLWALVPEKDFDDAIEFMFEDEIINSSLASKIYAYRDVLENTSATLTNAKMNGINVCIVSNYGYQILPATVSLDDMSDGIESVKYSSAGAVTTDNSTEDGHLKYCINDNHYHISPDEDIDASYCILPENTWFIKDLPHADMTKEPVATFLVWLIFGFSQRHVRENSNYTQFMKYSEYSKTLTAYTTPGTEEGSVKYGDVDYNEVINAADARLALRISVGLDTATKETKITADVDGDGKVTAADARLILRYAVGLEQGFPV